MTAAQTTTSPPTLRTPLRDESDDDETTVRILDAALHRFESLGIRRTTMDDVARQARVGRATVYRRFPHKNGLVEAVLARKVRSWLSRLEETMTGTRPMVERLVEGFVTMLRIAREDALIQRLLDVEPDDALPYLTVHAGPRIALCREYVAAHLRSASEHVDPAVDLDEVAELAVRLCLSLLLTPEGIIGADDQKAREFVRRYLVAVLRPTDGRQSDMSRTQGGRDA